MRSRSGPCRSSSWLAMSFLTDINLGLRYVLAILPYVFIATGKVVPWMPGASRPLAALIGDAHRRLARR